MKHFNGETYKRFLNDVGRHKKRNDKNPKDMLRFAKLAMKFAFEVNREEQRAGIYDFNDIYQTAMLGLAKGWSNIDWDKITKSANPDKTIANYLSSYIMGEIKSNLLKNSVGVNIPRHFVRKTMKEELEDLIFGNWQYLFKLDDYSPGTMLKYIDLIEDREEPYKNVILNDKLTTLLYTLPEKERRILDWNFGINLDKKMSMKEIAKELGMSEIGVKKAKLRALNKLKTEENEKLFEDFL